MNVDGETSIGTPCLLVTSATNESQTDQQQVPQDTPPPTTSSTLTATPTVPSTLQAHQQQVQAWTRTLDPSGDRIVFRIPVSVAERILEQVVHGTICPLSASLLRIPIGRRGPAKSANYGFPFRQGRLSQARPSLSPSSPCGSSSGPPAAMKHACASRWVLKSLQSRSGPCGSCGPHPGGVGVGVGVGELVGGVGVSVGVGQTGTLSATGSVIVSTRTSTRGE